MNIQNNRNKMHRPNKTSRKKKTVIIIENWALQLSLLKENSS